MTLLGRAAWWLPKWLDRILPNVDIEGEHLRHHLTDAALGAHARTRRSPPDRGHLRHRRRSHRSARPRGSRPATCCWSPATPLTAGSSRPPWPVASHRSPDGCRCSGSPLPSESGRALRRVALVDIAAGEAAFGDRTVGEVLSERIDLGQPWYRASTIDSQVRRWIGQMPHRSRRRPAAREGSGGDADLLARQPRALGRARRRPVSPSDPVSSWSSSATTSPSTTRPTSSCS